MPRDAIPPKERKVIPPPLACTRRKAIHLLAARIWQAMSGNGGAACGAKIPPSLLSSIHIALTINARMKQPEKMFYASCGAGRSAPTVSAHAARIAFGTARTTPTSTTGFGCRRPISSQVVGTGARALRAIRQKCSTPTRRKPRQTRRESAVESLLGVFRFH